MDNFTYHNYTNVVFGKDTETEAGVLTKALGNKTLLHYGGGSIRQSGLYDRVVASLQAAGVDFVELSGVQPNPRLNLVREGIDLCRREGVDCILAVGGGSVIDSAKAIAVGVPYDGDVWDFYTQKSKPETTLPIGVVLTIPAAGSETSTSSVISDEATYAKLGLRYQGYRPQFAILNPELTYSLPPYQLACGVCDMLAHIMERYFSSTQGVDFTDRLCEGGMRSILHIAPKLLDDPDDYDTRANLMWASCVAHGGILGVGRQEDWASHRLSHQISAWWHDLAHGAALSIALPAWMKYVYRENLPLFIQWAQRVMDVDLTFSDPDAIVLEGIRRLEAFFRRLDLPVRLSEIDADDRYSEAMAEKCVGVGAVKKLTKEDAIAIYRLML